MFFSYLLFLCFSSRSSLSPLLLVTTVLCQMFLYFHSSASPLGGVSSLYQMHPLPSSGLVKLLQFFLLSPVPSFLSLLLWSPSFFSFTCWLSCFLSSFCFTRSLLFVGGGRWVFFSFVNLFLSFSSVPLFISANLFPLLMHICLFLLLLIFLFIHQNDIILFIVGL